MLTGRGLNDLTSKVQVLVGLSLGFGALSTFATAFAFFWFVKIKRSFRHDLIMLLVQADFIKSVALVVFPIVQLSRGPISSTSPFCQYSGFVLSVGIEASDVAVLMIAIHSAMYILHPRSGLYPYRWVAYGAYVFVPILFASLAFADGGYEDLGAYCYLHRERGWSRLALGWIPHYVLMAFLIVTYLWIYIYIRVRVNYYDRRASTHPGSSTTPRRPSSLWGRSDKLRRAPSTSSVSGQSTAPTPPQQQQGVVPADQLPIQWRIPFHRGTATSQGEELRDDQNPLMMLDPINASLLAVRRATQGSSTTAIGSSITSSNPRTANSTHNPAPNGSVTGSLAKPALSTSRSSTSDEPGPSGHMSLRQALAMPSTFGASSPDEPGLSGHMSLRQALAMTRYEPRHGTHIEVASNAPYRPSEGLDSEVARNRERIRRQLRSLIVYPLIYMLTWLFPLINQAFGQAGAKKPLWLLCLSIISFAVQGFANAIVFTAREKP